MTEFERVEKAVVEVEVQLLNSGIDFEDMWDLGVEDDPARMFAQRDLDVVVVRTVDDQVEADPDNFHCNFVVLGQMDAEVGLDQLRVAETQF